jgi:hypothetical protein
MQATNACARAPLAGAEEAADAPANDTPATTHANSNRLGRRMTISRRSSASCGTVPCRWGARHLAEGAIEVRRALDWIEGVRPSVPAPVRSAYSRCSRRNEPSLRPWETLSTLLDIGDAAPPTSSPSTPASTSRSFPPGWPVRVGAILVVGLAAAFLVWLLVGGDDDESATPTVSTTLVSSLPATGTGVTRPSLESLAALRASAASSRTPVYWAGARGGTQLELTKTPTGAIFVRYLPKSAEAGDRRAFLTVAVYPRPNGFAEVKSAASEKGSRTIDLAGGGIAVYDDGSAQNVHLAYPGQTYQIEVFAPQAGVARRLVESGAIRPVS